MPGLNITPTFRTTYDGFGDILCQMGPLSANSINQGIRSGPSQDLCEGLYSPACAIRLVATPGGNFVLQYVETTNLPWPNWVEGPLTPSEVSWVTYWQTGTSGSGSLVQVALEFTPDGLLWTNDGGFSSNTAGNPQAILRLQDDGNLIIFNASGQAIWASKTSVGESTGANVP